MGRNFMRKEPEHMGQFAISEESFTLEEQIKSLGDDELLDFWEETQHLTRVMSTAQGLLADPASDPLSGPISGPVVEGPADERLHPEYERLILQELQVRSSRGELR